MNSQNQSKSNKNWASRHKVLTIIIVIIVFFVVVGVVGSVMNPQETNKTISTNTNGNSNTSTGTLAKIGEPVRDGKFEFIVKSVTCDRASVGTNDYLTKTAQGQFCLVDLSIKNIGSEAQSLFSENQYLFNSSGQKYSADSQATSYAAPSGDTWYSNINPGNSVSGVVVFDIPKDQKPTQAELHDSSFSNGIKVNLQ